MKTEELELLEKEINRIRNLTSFKKDREICIYYDTTRRQVGMDCPFVQEDGFSRCPTCPVPLKVRKSDKYGDYFYVGERFKNDPLSPIAELAELKNKLRRRNKQIRDLRKSHNA